MSCQCTVSFCTLMKLARLAFKEAQEFADLVGIKHGLRNVVEYCDRILVTDPNDILIFEGLTHAAAMRYCRAFSPGSRFYLDRSILSDLSQNQIEDHEFFKSLRDKFVTHSVNPFEENSVYAQVSEGVNGTIEIPNIQSHHLRMLFLKPDEVKNLKELAAAVLGEVEKLAGCKQAAVLERARKIPPNELEYTDGTATRINVSRGAVSKGR